MRFKSNAQRKAVMAKINKGNHMHIPIEKRNWKKAKVRFSDNVVYAKDNISLELFNDPLWFNKNNMNVIIRDKNQKSLESNLGKEIKVMYFDDKSKAVDFAEDYMERN